MYAVIKTGGKQYRVAEGDTLRVELLGVEKKDAFTFNEVLLVGNSGNGDLMVGRPLVEGASVEAEVIRNGRAKKIIVFKATRSKVYRRTKGHRQGFTEVRIKSIVV